MELTNYEKEELFLEFASRMAEMDKEDKKLRTANNNSALKSMSRYYEQEMNKIKRNPKAYDERGGFKFIGVYSAYLELRHAVIYLVNAKKKYEDKPAHCNMLDRNEDVEEAEKAGMLLIDAMIKYLLDGQEDGKLGEATYYHA